MAEIAAVIAAAAEAGRKSYNRLAAEVEEAVAKLETEAAAQAAKAAVDVASAASQHK